ncbi:Hypothetical predicted protein [Octopus vulgaris]|uniref:Uncharacterized protein n=1 Tax=Octopus vulgaris TaxID=6645 RepID=A0AA36FBD5_OCTVU|nr:Hypothetical predicted protein [Octopus vulgaris]
MGVAGRCDMLKKLHKEDYKGDTHPDVIERATRKVVDEKKSLWDVAVKQHIVDEIDERKSKPKKAIGTEKAIKGRGKSTKTGEEWVQCMICKDWAHTDCTDGRQDFLCDLCGVKLMEDDSD